MAEVESFLRQSVRLVIKFLRKKKRDHATDEEEILTSANALFHVSNASSLPGNGAKNLMNKFLTPLQGWCKTLP